MTSTAVLLAVLFLGVVIGLMALHSPRLSDWSHKKAAQAKQGRK